jgi:hypothetical protein
MYGIEETNAKDYEPEFSLEDDIACQLRSLGYTSKEKHYRKMTITLWSQPAASK